MKKRRIFAAVFSTSTHMQKEFYQSVVNALEQNDGKILIIEGPRQSGKSTMVQQALNQLGLKATCANADKEYTDNRLFVHAAWEKQRKSRSAEVLLLDNIQHIRNWDTLVQAEWEADKAAGITTRVVLIAASCAPFLRNMENPFMTANSRTLHLTLWTWPDMRDTFGWTLDQYVFFGGYPGLGEIVSKGKPWRGYVRSKLIEPALTNDILIDVRLYKPHVLLQIMEESIMYQGEVRSLNGILEQTEGAGNTIILSTYLEFLHNAHILYAIRKYSEFMDRHRASIPKMQVHGNAIAACYKGWKYPKSLQKESTAYEIQLSAAGAHLINRAAAENCKITCYWDRYASVDFIVSDSEGRDVLINIMRPKAANALAYFTRHYGSHRTILVGEGGQMSLEQLLSSNLSDLFCEK